MSSDDDGNDEIEVDLSAIGGDFDDAARAEKHERRITVLEHDISELKAMGGNNTRKGRELPSLALILRWVVVHAEQLTSTQWRRLDMPQLGVDLADLP